jgi:hypothetical protein
MPLADIAITKAAAAAPKACARFIFLPPIGLEGIPRRL